MKIQVLCEQLRYYFLKGQPLFPSRAEILKTIETILFNESLTLEQRICALETYFITSINGNSNLFTQNSFKVALKCLLSKRGYVTDRIGTVELDLFQLPFEDTRVNNKPIQWSKVLSPNFVVPLYFRIADIIEQPSPMEERLATLLGILTTLHSAKEGSQGSAVLERAFLTTIIQNVNSTATFFRHRHYEHSLWASASLEALETLETFTSGSELGELMTRALYYITCSIQRNEIIGFYVAYKFRQLLGLNFHSFKQDLLLKISSSGHPDDIVCQQYFFVCYLLEREQPEFWNKPSLTSDEESFQVRKFCSMMNGDYPYGMEAVLRLLLERDSSIRRCAIRAVEMSYESTCTAPLQLWNKIKNSSLRRVSNRTWVILNCIYTNAFQNNAVSFEINHYRSIGLTDDEITYKFLTKLFVEGVSYLDNVEQLIPTCLQDINSRLYTVVIRIITEIEKDPESQLHLSTRNRPGLLVAYFAYWAGQDGNLGLMERLALLSIEQSSACGSLESGTADLTPSYFGYYLLAEVIWTTRLKSNPHPKTSDIELFKKNLGLAKQSTWPQERDTFLAYATLMSSIDPEDKYWLTEEERGLLESNYNLYRRKEKNKKFLLLDEYQQQHLVILLAAKKILDCALVDAPFPPATCIYASLLLPHLQYYYYGERCLTVWTDNLLRCLENVIFIEGYLTAGSYYAQIASQQINKENVPSNVDTCRKLMSYIKLSEKHNYNDLARTLTALRDLSALAGEPFSTSDPAGDNRPAPEESVKEVDKTSEPDSSLTHPAPIYPKKIFTDPGVFPTYVSRSFYNPLSLAIMRLLGTSPLHQSLSDEVKRVFALHPDDTILDLSFIVIEIQAFEQLAEALETNDTIDQLILNHCCLGSKASGPLAKVLSQNRTIVSLDLSGNNFDSDAMINLTSPLESNPCLRSLDLSNNDLDDECLPIIATFIGTSSRLQHLNLGFNRFSCEVIIKVAPELFSSLHLRSFDISGINLNSFAIAAIAAALLATRRLSCLTLCRNNLDSAGVKPIIEVLPETQLSLIDFEHNEIDDSALSLMNRLLLLNSRIYHIGLDANRFNDLAALQTLSEILTHNRELIPLQLACIGFAYIKQLSSVSKTFGLLDRQLIVFILTLCLPFPVGTYRLPLNQSHHLRKQYVENLLKFIGPIHPKADLPSTQESIAFSTQDVDNNDNVDTPITHIRHQQ